MYDIVKPIRQYDQKILKHFLHFFWLKNKKAKWSGKKCILSSFTQLGWIMSMHDVIDKKGSVASIECGKDLTPFDHGMIVRVRKKTLFSI